MAEIAVTYEGDLHTKVVDQVTGQVLFTDAPKDNQGKGEYFSPTDLVGVALGSCTLTLMGIAAKRLGLDLKGARLLVKKEMKTTPTRMIGKLELDFYFQGHFDTSQTEQLEKAARSCPVHASLHPDIVQVFSFHWGQA